MQRSDHGVMVGLDDARPGDDEDVPAGLERGRHHPERLSESAADPVPNDRASQLASGRDPEASRREVGPQEPGGEQRVGPGGSLLLDRREVLRSREHHESRRTCAALGRQAVSRFRPRARRAARIRRPAVVFMRARKPCSLARWRFLGWYVCFVKAVLRSSRSDLGDGRSVFPLEARKRARCPARHMARRRPADDRAAPEWVSNVPEGVSQAPEEGSPRGSVGAPPQTVMMRAKATDEAPHGYSRGVCAICLATRSWPVLSSAGPRRRRRSRETPAASWRGAGSGRPASSDGRRSDAPPPRATTGILAAATSSTVNPERRSYRTNGRQAGLASRPG